MKITHLKNEYEKYVACISRGLASLMIARCTLHYFDVYTNIADAVALEID